MTIQSTDDRDPIEVLAEDFVQRLRDGHSPTIEDYKAQHPDLAEEIDELFPTIASIELSKTHGLPATRSSNNPKQLGDFHILREIGRGGMGVVYEARQESLDRRVAVKVFPRLPALDESHSRRFHREAQTAASLHHTNIVPVFGVGEQEGCYYYVMQYIDGAPLNRVLTSLEHSQITFARTSVAEIVTGLSQPDHATRQDNQASLPTTVQQGATSPSEFSPPSSELNPHSQDSSHWKAIADLAIQVADALAYAHERGVLHRDIKPANLIIDTAGVIWIADFGLAKLLETEQLSLTGEVLGTPAYMAPEQINGTTDHRSDIYSLGLTLYEMLTLRGAYNEPDRAKLLHQILTQSPPRPRQVRPEIPRDLETIVLKAIAHEPEGRYPTAAALADDLRRFVADRPIQAKRSSPIERLWLWRRRNPLVANLAATAVALLVLVAVTATVGYLRTSEALAGERAQRQKAEAATDVAVEVLDKIYDRFSPDPTADPGQAMEKPPLTSSTAATLEDMLTFYNRLAEQADGEEAYREKVALATRQIGDIRHHLGQLDQAKQAYLQSLAQYQQLHAQHPEQYLYEQAVVLTEYGIILHRQRDHAAAREQWEQANALLKQLPDDASQSDRLALSDRLQDLLAGRIESRRPLQSPNGFEPPYIPGRGLRPLGPPQ